MRAASTIIISLMLLLLFLFVSERALTKKRLEQNNVAAFKTSGANLLPQSESL
jgi:hypothetical protein